jgi:hypothetical protein
LQRELLRNLVVEAAYVGNRGMWWPTGVLTNFDALTPDMLKAVGLDINSAADRTLLNSPISSAAVVARGFKVPYAGFPVTATLAQSLRPFPQFNTGLAPLWAPVGDTWYNSLQVKATKRFSHGLDFTYAFTWSQELTLGTESDSVGPFGVAGAVNDIFNRGQNKYISAYSRPLVSNISANYTVPAWGSGKALRLALSNWQVGALLVYASGQPIQVPMAQNNLNPLLFRATAGTAISYANRVPGQPLFTVDLNCHCYDPNATFVLNPKAWQDPAPGQWGTSAAYYNDYRQQRRPTENFNFGRQFRIKERVSLSVRAEFTNIFNRTRFPNPTATNALATQSKSALGLATAGFGYMNTTNLAGVGGPRAGQIVARFRF